ncbi:hypothetical protein ACC704_37050, partial [Rhizobium johnstonii]
ADETDSNVGAITTLDGIILDIRQSDPDYDYQKVNQQHVGYQFEHEFDNGLTFRHNLRYSHLDLIHGVNTDLSHVGIGNDEVIGRRCARDAIGRI